MTYFSLYPALLTVRKRAVFVAAIAFGLFMTTSCSARHAPLVTTLSLKYHPIRIASNIQSRPGGFAWSPDGRTLVYLKKETINLYDTDSAKVSSLRIEGAHYLSWSETDSLLVLAKEKGKDILCTIDRGSLAVTRTTVDEGADALYAGADNRMLIVLSKRVNQFSYGTEIALQATSSPTTTTTHEPKILYSSTKIFPNDNLDQRAMLAWTHAGLHPLDNSLLIIEHSKPPVFAFYSRVMMIDTVSGDISEIAGRKRDIAYTSASWSPDGSMFALTRRDGSLEIHSLLSHKAVLDQPVPGAYPTWNPRSDSVYLGGRLIFLDGREPEALLSNAAWSIAAWSPDNATLAASAEGELWLFRGLGTASGQSDSTRNRTLARKVLLLQDLFRDNLISLQEYQERKANLLKRTENE